MTLAEFEELAKSRLKGSSGCMYFVLSSAVLQQIERQLLINAKEDDASLDKSMV